MAKKKSAKKTSQTPAVKLQQSGKTDVIQPVSGNNNESNDEKHSQPPQNTETPLSSSDVPSDDLLLNGKTNEEKLQTDSREMVDEQLTKELEDVPEPVPEPVPETIPESVPVSEPVPQSESVKDSINTHESLTSDVDILKKQIEQIESERDEIQEEYDSLLEKVGTIKQRLGERFKELEADANQARQREQKAIDEAQAAKEEVLNAKDEIVKAKEEVRIAKEASQKAAQKAAKETEELRKDLKTARELQISQKIMFDQELSNEKDTKQTLEFEIEQLKSTLETTSKLSSQSAKTCELQEKEISKLKLELQTMQKEKDTLRIELDTTIPPLLKERDEARNGLAKLQAQLADQTQSSVSSNERQQKLEKEAKEYQLLIGKLRHEAVILNDHLTNALRLVRKDSEGSTVDKELVSNLFVQFATCPRQDTKKFEILQLIANFLGWDEYRRQLVGLAKVGGQDLDQSSQPAQNSETSSQMVGVVGKLAEFLEKKRNNGK